LPGLSKVLAVITFLRLAGLGAGAAWLGGAIFYILALDPLLGRSDLLRLLGPLHAGEVAVLAAERFHLFQVICAILALILGLAEWLYTGRPVDRRLIFLLVSLLALASLGRLYLAPKCRALNMQAYLSPNRQVQRQAETAAQRKAEHSLAVWQGVSVVVNVISLAGVSLYFLQGTLPSNSSPRLFPRTRLRI
jgi:hypothetical protein